MKYLFQTLIALCLISSPKLVFSRDTMTFSAPREFTAYINEIIVREAYNRIGYDIEVFNVPPRRALEMSNEGEVDGELFRIAEVVNFATNLRMVPTPINEFEVRAYSMNIEAKVDSWISLKPYKIGIVRGHKFSERGTRGMNRIVAKNLDLLFNMLEIGRIDVVVNTHLSGLEIQRTLGTKGIHQLEGLIDVVPVYHFVHKDNAKLIPALDSALKDMKAENQPQYSLNEELTNFLSIKTEDHW